MPSLAHASQFLTPRVLCVAVAASSAATGRPGRASLPRLHALATSPNHAPAYADLLRLLGDLPLLPDGAVEPESDDELSDEDDAYETVGEYLDSVIAGVLSVDELYGVVESLLDGDDVDVGTLIHGVYDRDGPIACLMRKVVVMCSALSFEGAVSLVDSLRAYIESTEPDPPVAPINGTSQNLTEAAVANTAAFALAAGGPIPSDATFAALNSAPPTFATHLESLRRRDYSASIDALHRHYDLSLASIVRSSSSTADAADSRGHQYAALSLAALHFHLGHPRLAVAALDDAVRAAQQCADDACQARALAWIARTSTSPEQRHQLLLHARDGLALAREELLTVVTPTAKAARVSVGIVRGESVWQRDNRLQVAVSQARLRRIHGYVGFGAGDVSVESLLVSAAAWESHAAMTTAVTVARMALRFARREQKRGRRRAGSVGGAARGEREASKLLTGREATALAAVALLDAKCGRAREAIASVVGTAECVDGERIKPDFALDKSSSRPEREVLVRCATWLKFERALRRGETIIAGRFAETIATFAPPSKEDGDPIGGADAELDAIEARCRWLMASRCHEDAVMEADLLARRAAKLTRPVRVVDGLRLGAQAHTQAGAANSALPLALAAVSLSRGLGIEAGHVRSVLALTEAMLRIDGSSSSETAAAASRTLDNVLPRALEGLGVWERGVARRLQAECLLATEAANGKDASSQAKASCAGAVVDSLTDAIDAFETAEYRLGLRDCWYMLARVHHEVGNFIERAIAARNFRHQVKELAHAQVATTEVS